MDLSIFGLYRPTLSDMERCAQVAATAFVGDPSLKYQLGGREPSVRQLRHYFSVVLRTGFPYYHIYATSREIDGFIVLLKPGVQGTPSLRFLCGGGWKLPFLTCPDVLIRLAKYEEHCQRIRQSMDAMDAWYILMLAVDPQQQGKGHASRLMKAVLEALDENAARCYLETHKEKNVAIYRHYGFQTVQLDTVPDGANAQFAMLRSAHP